MRIIRILKQQYSKAMESIKSSLSISEGRKLVMINQNEKNITTMLDRYRNIENYYGHLPYFSNIILDDEEKLACI